MRLIIISQLTGHLLLLLLLATAPHLVIANPAQLAPPNDCLKCHNDIWQEAMTKKYLHAPFQEKKCTECHAADTLPGPENPGIPGPGDARRIWAEKSLIPATSHWFEFAADENPATMILEASYGSLIRLYREIPLPSLDSLPEVTTLYNRNPPQISKVTVLAVKKDISLSATITWQTDRPTGNRITYGVEGQGQTTPRNDRLNTEHLETLTNLKPGRTYQFRITVEDTLGNRTESDIFKFSTAGPYVNPGGKDIIADCCLATPLGLASNFFRKGDRYLINITFARPVKIYFTLKKRENINTEVPGAAAASGNQAQITRHIITTEEEIVTFIVCKRCHGNFLTHHPINVYPKRGMKIPAEYPTMADGRISCISCHAPHASNQNYLLIKDHRQDLCIGCHDPAKSMGK